jgi:hypothetical protein
MLYIGQFQNYKEEENGGAYFVYFAEADNPDNAVEIFKAGITKTANQQDTGISGKVYLESIVEIGKVPTDGAMAFLHEIDYQDPSSTIICTLPGDSCGLESYHWAEDGQEPDDIFEMTPFLIIPAPRKTKAPGGQVCKFDFTKKRRR